MQESDKEWLNAIHNDYDSFIASFKEAYTNEDYSVVWKESLPCPPREPFDRLDRWELTLFELGRTVELRSNLRIFNTYTGNLTGAVNRGLYDEVKFEIIDDIIGVYHCYGGNNAQKIVDESLYEEIENTPSTAHLAAGNSYLEHVLICEFLCEHANLWEDE